MMLKSVSRKSSLSSVGSGVSSQHSNAAASMSTSKKYLVNGGSSSKAMGDTPTGTKTTMTTLATLLQSMDWSTALSRIRTKKGKKESSIMVQLNPTPENTDKGDLPLHIALNQLQRTPPEDLSTASTVISELIKVYPEGCETPNGHGALPLHEACDAGCPMEIVKMVTDAYPEALGIARFVGNDLPTAQTTRGALPLHCAVSRQPNPLPNVILAILAYYPAGSKSPDNNGHLPLHLAVIHGLDQPMIKKIWESYPEAVDAMDDYGLTPYRYAERYKLGDDVKTMLRGTEQEEEGETVTVPVPEEMRNYRQGRGGGGEEPPVVEKKKRKPRRRVTREGNSSGSCVVDYDGKSPSFSRRNTNHPQGDCCLSDDGATARTSSITMDDEYDNDNPQDHQYHHTTRSSPPTPARPSVARLHSNNGWPAQGSRRNLMSSRHHDPMLDTLTNVMEGDVNAAAASSSARRVSPSSRR